MANQRKTIVLWGALHLLLASAALAAEPLTLPEASAIAVEHSFALEATRADIDVARLGVRAARARQLPRLNAAGSQGAFDGEVFFANFIPGAPPGGTDVGAKDGTSLLALELTQTLYAGGAHRAARRLGEVDHALAREELRRQELELVYDVASAYYNVLLAEKNREVAARSVRRSEEGLEIVRLRFAEQEALRVELLGAESQLAADRLASLEAENQIGLARAALNRLLGRPLDAELELAGGLEDPSEVPLEADGIAAAAASSPMIRQAGLAIDRATELKAQGRSLGRPKLELQGFYQDLDNELFFDGSHVGVTLNLSIPFVQEIAAARAAVGQAEGRKRHGDASRQELESSVRLAATTAYRRLQESRAAIAVAEKSLEYQEERYRVSLSAYREAVKTYSEVLDDHALLSQAELRLHGAHLQTRLAEAAVRKIVGLEGPDPG